MKNEIQHPIQIFLQFLDNKEIKYVCWKDLNLLGDVFEGKKDLDILILAGNTKKLVQIANGFGALILRNRFENTDDLIHLFLQGEGGEVFHVHVYTRLITGESWVKEFHLPIERKVLQQRIWDLEYNIWVIPESLNQEFIILRYLLKITSLFSLYSYRKKRSDATHYIYKIQNGPSQDVFVNISKMLNKNLILLKSDNIKIHYFSALKLREKLLKYRRFTLMSLFFRRLKGAYVRLLKKYVYKEKKIFPNQGVILAITGVDGSGKSSLIASTENYYSKILTTRRTHIGRPYPNFIGNIFQIFRNKNASKNVNLSKETTSLLKSIFALFLALSRLRRAQKITRLAEKGYLVLVDRWPTRELGKMDGPRVKFNENSSLCIWYLGKCEHHMYNKIPSSDICIILHVSLDDAQLRNSTRKKVNKESAQEIEQRFYKNYEFVPKSKNIINYNNTSDLVTAKHDIIKLSWTSILDQVTEE
ncbi:hypothetical protein N9O40_00035 [Planktomarina sp.]|nr:hypothetical protein [Planktomarina sp.]